MSSPRAEHWCHLATHKNSMTHARGRLSQRASGAGLGAAGRGTSWRGPRVLACVLLKGGRAVCRTSCGEPPNFPSLGKPLSRVATFRLSLMVIYGAGLGREDAPQSITLTVNYKNICVYLFTLTRKRGTYKYYYLRCKQIHHRNPGSVSGRRPFALPPGVT